MPFTNPNTRSFNVKNAPIIVEKNAFISVLFATKSKILEKKSLITPDSLIRS